MAFPVQKPAAANDNERITWVTGGFMLTLAVILDGLQVLFTISIFLILGSLMASFLAIVIFGLWFYLLGANFFGGRRVGLKVIAVFASISCELVPILDAIPCITLGVLAAIIATRLEDREKKSVPLPRETHRTIRDLPQAANDDEGSYAREAA